MREEMNIKRDSVMCANSFSFRDARRTLCCRNFLKFSYITKILNVWRVFWKRKLSNIVECLVIFKNPGQHPKKSQEKVWNGPGIDQELSRNWHGICCPGIEQELAKNLPSIDFDLTMNWLRFKHRLCKNCTGVDC